MPARLKTTPKRKPEAAPAVKRRTRPDVIARREIRKYRNSDKASLPYKPFTRLVRQIMRDQGFGDYKLKEKAIEALRESAEQFLVEKFLRAEGLRGLTRNTMLSLKYWRAAFTADDGVEGACFAELKRRQQAENDAADQAAAADKAATKADKAAASKAATKAASKAAAQDLADTADMADSQDSADSADLADMAEEADMADSADLADTVEEAGLVEYSSDDEP
jgi:histone H3/H4